MDKNPSTKPIFLIYLFILCLWGFYRANEFLPEWLEEAFLKPVIFLGPVLWWVFKREKRSASSLGLTSKNFSKACFFGLGLGLIYSGVALLTNIAKYGKLSIASLALDEAAFWSFLGLALVTSFSEVMLFFGFLLMRLKEAWRNEIKVLSINALLFSLMYLPIVFFVYEYNIAEAISYFFLTFSIAFANGFLMLRSKNLIAPILSQTFWAVSLYFFR